MEIAKEILNQLGGNRFIAMTGAKHFRNTESGKGLAFQLPMNTNSYIGKIKFVNIELMPTDTYTVEFINRKGVAMKEYEGVYADMLQGIFTQNTGLATSL